MGKACARAVKVLIAGTPGVGKTTLSRYIAEKMGWDVVSVSDVIEQEGLYERRCEKYDTLEYSPKKVRRYLKKMEAGKSGRVFDTHDPECVRFVKFGALVVLSCDLSVLYRRYQERKYSEEKSEENNEAEIMEVAYTSVIEELCKTEEEIEDIIRVCTTDGKREKTLAEIFGEIEKSATWKKMVERAEECGKQRQ